VDQPASPLEARIRRAMRDVADFPRPGILFKDITPLLLDPVLLRDVVATLGAAHGADGITRVAGIESRGFLLAAPVAQFLGAGLVPIRKAGKLPFRTERVSCTLEYGTAELEVHVDAWGPGDRVLVIDDVLATGGTAEAACTLVERLGATVAGLGFLIELGFLGGAARLPARRLTTLVTY
jgi:adenine phosphoribosyltransferase